ncbi:hypothetical protein RGQ15_02030 [Paracoccus sp. MBLB3053]|uniref:Uncharacterized protein n=1 Tax=Paracoccus aurantius TaxID=3073814 RepID=A0ABU2HNL3_9RHOB|nr:hypothetical protein [Paracoccus sp. MBLB3053]MDS9466352.1 hypothetical protein [Paracoccus sp. MBLB3053]
MDKLLFGDNQFFGINHMSEEKARAQAMRFQNLDAIMEVLDSAYDEGIRTFMCTTHDRVAQIANRIGADRSRYADFTFYPCMPYAHKYANAVTEHGIVGALRGFMPADGLLGAALAGGKALATKEVDGIAKVLIDMEMKMFQGAKAPVVFIQNVFTDLLLGMGFTRAFRIFHDHITQKYNAEPAYITMNMPALLDALEKEGIERPIICSNINKIGFRMSGGYDRYLDALKSGRVRAIAMSVFASGAIPADEAIHWISELPGVESIVFGASSARNIRSTRELVDRYMGGV